MKEIIHNNLEDTEKLLLQQFECDGIEYSTWTKDKANLKYNKQLPNFPITNNFIYWCNLGINIGSEQNKLRPVLILKTQKTSTMCTVIPLTSERINDTRWYHIDLEEQNSTALIEQLRFVSKLRIVNPQRIKGKLVKITKNDWNKINTALSSYYKLMPLE